MVQAREEGDADAETLALKQLEIRLKSEARDIRDKYIAPPYSTDFGLLYLPLEGLFAEAVSRPGLISELQRKYRVTLVGPTTLAAVVNSLQMGFRTLVVQKQTSQVWPRSTPTWVPSKRQWNGRKRNWPKPSPPWSPWGTVRGF